jgi:hypothetical protein
MRFYVSCSHALLRYGLRMLWSVTTVSHRCASARLQLCLALQECQGLATALYCTLANYCTAWVTIANYDSYLLCCLGLSVVE